MLNGTLLHIGRHIYTDLYWYILVFVTEYLRLVAVKNMAIITGLFSLRISLPLCARFCFAVIFGGSAAEKTLRYRSPCFCCFRRIIIESCTKILLTFVWRSCNFQACKNVSRPCSVGVPSQWQTREDDFLRDMWGVWLIMACAVLSLAGIVRACTAWS